MNRAQKEYYKRDYAQAKAEGKPFFPYAVYKDLIIATLAIGLVIALAIWHRVEVGEPVNPASTDFVPRPEWYFFFLFELLKIFKGQNALMPVIMATFIVPNILMLLLIATPFIDRGPERRIQEAADRARSPAIAVIVFLAYMTNKGGELRERHGASALPLTGLESTPRPQAGATLFLANGLYSRATTSPAWGRPGPGPNLTNEGTKGHPRGGHGPELPEQPAPGNVCRTSQNFTPEQYKQIGTFIEGLGTKYRVGGTPNGPVPGTRRGRGRSSLRRRSRPADGSCGPHRGRPRGRSGLGRGGAPVPSHDARLPRGHRSERSRLRRPGAPGPHRRGLRGRACASATPARTSSATRSSRRARRPPGRSGPRDRHLRRALRHRARHRSRCSG